MAWTTPETFTAGQTLTAASMNVISGNLNAIGGAWTAYTPTLTNITGTASGRYIEAGKLVIFEAQVVVTSVTGIIGISLPVTAASSRAAMYSGLLRDVGVNFYPAIATANTTRVDLYAPLASATYLLAAATSSTVPFTWGANDEVEVFGVYEAA